MVMNNYPDERNVCVFIFKNQGIETENEIP